MSSSKNTAIVATIAFLVGTGIGHWVIPPESPTEIRNKSKSHDHAAAEHVPTTQPVSDGANCTMENCGVDRPQLEARLAENPNDIAALLELGACDIDMAAPDVGVARLRHAAHLASDPMELITAGKLLAKAGQPDAGLAAFEKALKADPKNAEALYRGGLIAFHDAGNNSLAVSYWKRYLEVAPNAPNADLIRRSIEQM